MSPEMVKFTVPGKPQAKQRHRHMRFPNGHTHTYTPDETVNYENLVRMMARQAMAGHPPLAGPVSLFLEILLPCPGSWSGKRKREAYAGEIMPTKKPDADNVEKAIKDGCNRIAWQDDAQVVNAEKSKRYAETPAVHVTIYELPARRAP